MCMEGHPLVRKQPEGSQPGSHGESSVGAAVADAKVWRDLDQRALDDAYDQAKHAPDQSHALVRHLGANARALARMGPPQRLQYGLGEAEGIDFYKSTVAVASAPVLLYVHGGAWRKYRSADFSSLAEPFVAAGAHVAIIDFVNVDEAGGDLSVMVEQLRAAVAHLYRHAGVLGIDADRMHLGGHSSGAHLASCLLVTDWPARGLPRMLFRGALLSSGMYDLAPVRLSSRSRYVKFTDDMVQRLSAMRHLDLFHTPVIVCWGTEESPEFQRHGRELVMALQEQGKPVTAIEARGYDHFEINRTLGNPYGLLGRLLLEQMELA